MLASAWQHVCRLCHFVPAQYFIDLSVDCRLQRFNLVRLNQVPDLRSSAVDARARCSLAGDQAAPICQLGLEYLT